MNQKAFIHKNAQHHQTTDIKIKSKDMHAYACMCACVSVSVSECKTYVNMRNALSFRTGVGAFAHWKRN